MTPLKRLLCWHRWVKQQETVLFSAKAETLLAWVAVSFVGLLILTVLCSAPKQHGSPEVTLDLGLGAWVVKTALVAVIGCGIYLFSIYNPSDQVTLRSISDRTCYKCNKVVMDVTDRNVAIKNAEARLLAHRKTIQEVNDEMWRPQ